MKTASDQGTGAHRRTSTGALVACAVVVCVGLLLPYGPDHVALPSDTALQLGVAFGMREGEIPLAGLPSHLGGRHFGSWPFGLLAACIAAGGSIAGTAALLTILKTLVALVALWASFRALRPAGGSEAGTVAVSLCLLSASYDDVLRGLDLNSPPRIGAMQHPEIMRYFH